LIASCDIVLLPNVQTEDLAEMKVGQVIWAWPHCVQDAALTQMAIDRRLTLIAFEAMNHWQADGGFRLHVFTRTTSPATQRDGWVRPAITTLLDRAQHQNCTAVVVENPDFADARAVERETLGRGARGKRLRRAVAGMHPAKFRARLTGMAGRRGSASLVSTRLHQPLGEQHWKTPLQQQTSGTVTRHHAAAAAIGRRGLRLAIRRRPAGPRTGLRTAAGTTPTRPHHQPTHGGRYGSSGPPKRTHRGVPVHRRTPARRGQHRSGRTQAGLTPAR
jgi:hypothetical protein